MKGKTSSNGNLCKHPINGIFFDKEFTKEQYQRIEKAARHCEACAKNFALIIEEVKKARGLIRTDGIDISRQLIHVKINIWNGNLIQAKSLLEDMINKGVEHSDVFYMLGEVFRQEDKNSEAIKYLLKALSYKVHSPYVYESLGQCYYQICEYTKSKQLLKN